MRKPEDTSFREEIRNAVLSRCQHCHDEGCWRCDAEMYLYMMESSTLSKELLVIGGYSEALCQSECCGDCEHFDDQAGCCEFVKPEPPTLMDLENI
jgi:hypothetical protein